MSTRIEQAREFALTAHGEQLYGSHPYIAHLDAVVALLSARVDTKPFAE
ncbi:MAG: hypothetical protein RIC55_23100 [Pirellulaceae bacterium]